MDNNDVVRSLRDALDLSDSQMIDVFALAGPPVSQADFLGLLVDEGHEDHVRCPDSLLTQLLDGLIVDRRGPRPPGAAAAPQIATTNNVVLRKLKIAFDYHDVDVIRVLRVGGHEISQPELSPLFRKVGNRHYRPAGDQLLQAFLAGLAIELRAEAPTLP